MDQDRLTTRITRVLRGSRKLRGFKQVEVANALGLQQAAWSRIENGRQVLAAVEWLEFCKFVGISPDSLSHGFAEFGAEVMESVNNEFQHALPRRFSFDAHSRVRTALPFLIYFQDKLGEKALNQHLKLMGIDSDLLVCPDTRININLVLELAEALTRKGLMGAGSLSELTESVSRRGVHGQLHFLYRESGSQPLALMETLISHADRYERNFAYSIESAGDAQVDISVTPRAHMDAFPYRSHPVLGDFLLRYRREYFASFSRYEGGRGAKVEIKEKYRSKDLRSVYRVTAVA